MKYKVVDLSGRVRALSDSYPLAVAYRDYLCVCGVSARVCSCCVKESVVF